MIEHKLKLYEVKFGPFSGNAYSSERVFAYTEDELLNQVYTFIGYRSLPLLSEAVQSEYVYRIRTLVNRFIVYDGFKRHITELDFDVVYKLHSRLQRDSSNRLIGACNRLDFCIELLELIMINWNE